MSSGFWPEFGSSVWILKALLVSLAFVYLFSGLDDLFIDLVARIFRLKPEALSAQEMQEMDDKPQRNIAIIVPAWKESGVIQRMLVGNLHRLEYTQYHFFVGVYPNDPATGKKVRKVRHLNKNVHPVMNDRPGPTSKGQILNRVIRHIIDFEKRSGIQFDAFLMQDSEDLIHPKVLKLINRRLDDWDFLQVPVFSLNRRWSQFVAGTYMDEFTEIHLKDILVRQALGAAIPSAGVGTALSRRLVLSLLQTYSCVFNESSLTEDYVLGLRAHKLGYKCGFLCCYFEDWETGQREFIATREYFPSRFRQSVRQKTRWTLGISLQGLKHVGWTGSLSNRYFLFRDRRGLVTNIAAFLGYPCLILGGWVGYSRGFDIRSWNEWLGILFFINIALMLNRLIQRAICLEQVYGWAPVWTMPLRWPVANLINALATYHAIKRQLISALKRSHQVVWVKTDHELPEYFGQASRKVKLVP